MDGISQRPDSERECNTDAAIWQRDNARYEWGKRKRFAVVPVKLASQFELKADGLSDALAQVLVGQLPNFVFQSTDIQCADLVAQRD